VQPLTDGPAVGVERVLVGEAPVDQSDVASVGHPRLSAQQHVFELEISVHDADCMRALDDADELCKDGCRLVFA